MIPPEFLIIPYLLIADEEINPLDERVYGVIYWLTQLKGEKCTASNPTLAELCKTTPQTLGNCLTKLEKRGYIDRIFKDEQRKLRKEIIPLVVFKKVSSKSDTYKKVSPTDDTVSPTDDTKVSPTGEQNNSIINNSNKQYIAKPSFAVNEIIELFNFNPSYKKFFKNITQRKAVERLISQHGEKLPEMIKALPQTNKMQYAPIITTPLQLEDKLASLVAFIGKKRSEINKNKIAKIQ